jgi:hypothetical protein
MFKQVDRLAVELPISNNPDPNGTKRSPGTAWWKVRRDVHVKQLYVSVLQLSGQKAACLL